MMMTRLIKTTMAVCLLLTLAITSPASAATYTDGDSWAVWNVVFAGYGKVTVNGTGSAEAISLSPAASVAADETHAALVVGTANYRDARVKMRVTLNSQLRLNTAPNSWETGWVVTRYTDNEHFYYLALKTNGWELGKRDPAYPGGQRFLATGTTPKTVKGRAQIADLAMRGSKITVRIDGTIVATFTDRERPYLSGAVGMYTEDAAVTFDKITVTQL